MPVSTSPDSDYRDVCHIWPLNSIEDPNLGPHACTGELDNQAFSLAHIL